MLNLEQSRLCSLHTDKIIFSSPTKVASISSFSTAIYAAKIVCESTPQAAIIRFFGLVAKTSNIWSSLLICIFLSFRSLFLLNFLFHHKHKPFPANYIASALKTEFHSLLNIGSVKENLPHYAL